MRAGDPARASLKKLNERILDPFMREFFAGLFPKDNPRNTRFAINFFTSIGLGGLTYAHGVSAPGSDGVIGLTPGRSRFAVPVVLAGAGTTCVST